MDLLDTLLGLGAEGLTPLQMALRAVLTFVVTLVIVRLGHKRMFGKGTAFDLVVAIMVGSVMSRAITNTQDLLAIWLSGLVLIMMHRLASTLACKIGAFGPVVKGHPLLLVKDGQVQHAAMRRGHISMLDLDQALRESGSEPDLTRVRLAYLERDGGISVVPHAGSPHVLEVSVADNVQTVRIALQ